TLTGMDPLPADGETEYLSVNPGTMTLGSISQTISIFAFSSSNIIVRSAPSWVSLKSNTQDIRNYTLVFDVSQNKSGAQREGTIVLENADGLSASVQLTQRYTYYSEDYSRDGNVVTLQTHTSGNGIDLIFFGDAYTDKEVNSGVYLNDMKRGVNAFFSVEPYASLRNLFDVKYVELVSASNSFTEGSQTALSTYFGEGTLVGGDDNKVSSYCKQVTGKSDLKDVTAIVIVNARKYAGTCYMYYNYSGDYGLGFSVSYFGLGTSASGQTSMEAVLRHEAGGHGFGKLSDEYSYYNNGAIPAGEKSTMKNMQKYGWYPNVDFTSDPFSVSWSKFVTDNRYSAEEIGVYEGAATYWYGAYRPTVNSIMRYNTGKFNAPSREAIYKKVHKLAYGSSWTYDYNKFLEYDAINRTSVSQAYNEMPVGKNIQPLHPPVVIYREP
ncbi:MAG: M64 family metallo-endopeptidase, partial [Bacteroidales bacterium]|nr:M64 family metallo-endopeptidase [Bacteroidales bacterium]